MKAKWSTMSTRDDDWINCVNSITFMMNVLIVLLLWWICWLHHWDDDCDDHSSKMINEFQNSVLTLIYLHLTSILILTLSTLHVYSNSNFIYVSHLF